MSKQTLLIGAAVIITLGIAGKIIFGSTFDAWLPAGLVLLWIGLSL